MALDKGRRFAVDPRPYLVKGENTVTATSPGNRQPFLVDQPMVQARRLMGKAPCRHWMMDERWIDVQWQPGGVGIVGMFHNHMVTILITSLSNHAYEKH